MWDVEKDEGRGSVIFCELIFAGEWRGRGLQLAGWIRCGRLMSEAIKRRVGLLYVVCDRGT